MNPNSHWIILTRITNLESRYELRNRQTIHDSSVQRGVLLLRSCPQRQESLRGGTGAFPTPFSGFIKSLHPLSHTRDALLMLTFMREQIDDDLDEHQ